jgi:hypothetical protein
MLYKQDSRFSNGFGYGIPGVYLPALTSLLTLLVLG